MKINLYHNRIIKETASPRFAESIKADLVPKLDAEYRDIKEILFYEDFLSDGFLIDGEFFYPLTVISESGVASRRFVKWSVDAESFTDSVPYSYVGDGIIEFTLTDAPEELARKIAGRAIKPPKNAISLSLEYPKNVAKTFLAGKLSQSFADLLAASVTSAIERIFGISGVCDSSLSLTLPFAPGTYMEHVSDNSCYRRISISAKGCSARDLWIKWTAINRDAPYSVSDHVAEADIIFELTDRVPQKIKEKEYRYIAVEVSPEAYAEAMGRKHMTEWRDLIKRVIKRGEVDESEPRDAAPAQNPKEKAEEKKPEPMPEAVAPVSNIPPEVSDAPSQSESDDMSLKIKQVLENYGKEEEPAQNEETEEINPDLNAWLKDILNGASREEEKAEAPEEVSEVEEVEEAEEIEEIEEVSEVEEVEEVSEAEETSEVEETSEEASEPEHEPETVFEESITLVCEEEEEIPEAVEETEEPAEEEIPEEPEDPEVPEREDGDDIAELSEALRRESAEKAAREAELIEEATRAKDESRGYLSELRELREEYQRALVIKKEKEEAERVLLSKLETKDREIAELREELSSLKEKLLSQKRAEEREKERYREAAWLAIEEQRRRESERRELMAEREAEMLEKARREDFERREEDRLEAQRIAEEKEKLEADRKRREAELAAAVAEASESKYRSDVSFATEESEEVRYTSKTAYLFFRSALDPNIIKKIKEIVLATVRYFKKEDVYMKIKASIPEPSLVKLEFLRIPETEFDLLKSIIRVLGNSRMGIVKVTLD